MEEILASIRRIISEDDAPAEAVEAAPAVEASAEPQPAVAAAPEPAPIAEPEPPLALAPEPETGVRPPEDEEEALELTEKVETMGDLDVFSGPALEAATPLSKTVGPLVSDRAASAAASSFGALSAAILMPHGDRTLEDVVRELLRPMLQQWLDDNLPAVVQQAVDAEVDRIARSRVR